MLKMHPPESSCRSFVYTEKASCYKNKCGCMRYSHSYIIRLSAAVPVVSALKEWSVGWMIITAVCDITELSNQRGTKLSEDSCHNTADIGGKDVKQKKRCFMWREDSKKIKVSRIETLLHPEEFLLLWSPENWTLLPHCRGNMELTSSLWPSPGLLEIILPLYECVWACWRVCVCPVTTWKTLLTMVVLWNVADSPLVIVTPCWQIMWSWVCVSPLRGKQPAALATSAAV